MSEPVEQKSPSRLSEVIREVKNAAADRDDVVVELREAHKMRLELLALELMPIFAEVPEDAGFDFAISSGAQPRLWIDAVSHVAMGRDRRTYRFLKDTRLGRVVLAESLDIKPVAEQVTRYVAERIVERERMLEGDVEPILPVALAEEQPAESRAVAETWAVAASRPVAAVAAAPRQPSKSRRLLSGLLLVVAGAAVGLIVAAALLWDRLSELGISF